MLRTVRELHPRAAFRKEGCFVAIFSRYGTQAMKSTTCSDLLFVYTIPMQFEYPLLEKVYSHYQKQMPTVSAGDITLVACQHLLEPQSKMFEYFVASGLKPENIRILGKVYSSNAEIISGLQNSQMNVWQPKFCGKAFDEHHQDNCIRLAKDTPTDNPVVILDDGAELIRAFRDTNHKVLFAVEQTSSGFRKLDADAHTSFPVLNVARSETKLIQESPLVAQLCCSRILEHTAQYQLDRPSFLVVGLGPIGQAVVEQLRENGYRVVGFEQMNGDHDLPSCIEKNCPDVVIGATGFPTITQQEIEALSLDKRLHFISVSSSDREFPVSSFRRPTNLHNDIVAEGFVFANNGFPVSFKGNLNELPPNEIEKTIALLMGSVLYGLRNDLLRPGLIDVPKELEKMVNE